MGIDRTCGSFAKNAAAGLAMWAVTAALTVNCGGTDGTLGGSGRDAATNGSPDATTSCGASGAACCNGTACNAGLTCTGGTCTSSSAIDGEDAATDAAGATGAPDASSSLEAGSDGNASSDAGANNDADAGCAAGALRCDGQQPQTCQPDGTWAATRSSCVNQACVAGGCIGLCMPGATQCAGVAQVQSCDAEGKWAAATACPSGDPSSLPECTGGSCTFYTCAAGYVPSNGVCTGDAGACAPATCPACTIGAPCCKSTGPCGCSVSNLCL